ncbi:MAG: hypothetical protein [Arizlama microvirus]|nr:MAG: hypothetical protein [Arizlama microvirus]
MGSRSSLRASWALGSPFPAKRLFMPEGHAKLYFLELIMDRFPVSKYSSARSFERSAGHTRSINYITPQRGGWRL